MKANTAAGTSNMAAVLACLEAVDAMSPARTNPRGRKRYPASAMMKALIMKELLQLSSRRKLGQLLLKNPELAQRCGFMSIPEHSSFAYFIRRMGRDRFVRLFEVMSTRLSEQQVYGGRAVAIDGTLLSAYSKPRANRPPSDSEAAWGVRSTGDWVFGYKLHLVCDTETELPIAFEVTSGNV
jgi:transposase